MKQIMMRRIIGNKEMDSNYFRVYVSGFETKYVNLSFSYNDIELNFQMEKEFAVEIAEALLNLVEKMEK